MEDILLEKHKTKSIDNHFGAFMARLAGEKWQAIAPVAGMVSMATRAGHACLDFRNSPEEWKVISDDEGSEACWPGQWPPEIKGCPVVGDGPGSTPLVLEDGRLYLRRYWQYEKDIADYVLLKSGESDRAVDFARLEQGMARLFPGRRGGVDWQKLAAMAVLLRPFVVITGGPGTGKTTTLVRIMVLLLEQQAGEDGLRIALAAPTGKGVARLQAVMAEIGKGLDCQEDIRAKIPTGAMTLHRLLGPIKGSPFFKFNADNRLPYDLVVVDEASMVDLPLMAKLTRALPPEARLVLLGDHNQLASVEPGAVLGD
ncbi:MAG: AAA family ATPase, partial [Thermodesulfobacteriota bacterium]